MANVNYYKEHVKILQKEKAFRNRFKDEPHESNITGVFTLVFFGLLLVAVFKVLSGSAAHLTFTGFLNGLQTMPHVDMSWAFSFQVSDAIASIPILGGALKALTGLTQIAIWICLGIVEVINVATWSVGFLFS